LSDDGLSEELCKYKMILRRVRVKCTINSAVAGFAEGMLWR